ncbi:hypothetical protein ABBQ38_014066 [Trebouxia sp. C0009 RCD-2024]
MTTVGELVDKGDIPEERKDNVKKVLHGLGYAASRAVGKAVLKITEKHMTDAGMSIADANAILAEVEPLQGTLDSTGGHGRDVSAEGISLSDLVKLRGKVKVLKKGDPETGDTKSISLYRSGDDPPSLKNKDGHLAGRLYLKNVNIMVPADTAMVEVVAPTREIRPPFLPEENSNGLSEELFAFDSVIRVSSYTDKRWRRIRVVVLQQMVAIVGIILTVVLHFIPPKV